MTVIDFNTRRIDRLEKAQKETNERLGRVEDSLGQIVSVLDVHTRHFERMEDALFGIADRVDHLTIAIARGRTQDLTRFDRAERRLTALEARSRRTPKRR